MEIHLILRNRSIFIFLHNMAHHDSHSNQCCSLDIYCDAKMFGNFYFTFSF